MKAVGLSLLALQYVFMVQFHSSEQESLGSSERLTGLAEKMV